MLLEADYSLVRGEESERRGDGIRAAQRLHLGAKRHHIRIVPALDGLLRADLYAAVALPALLRFLIVGFHRVAGLGTVLVEPHQIMGTNVHACSFVLSFAAITFLCAHICWHTDSPIIIVIGRRN